MSSGPLREVGVGGGRTALHPSEIRHSLYLNLWFFLVETVKILNPESVCYLLWVLLLIAMWNCRLGVLS